MLEDGGSRRKSAEIFAAQVAAENEGHAAFYGFSLSVGLAYALSVFLRVPIAHEEILETFLKRDELIVSGAFVGVHDEERQGADARIILPRQGPGPVDVMKDALGYGIVARFLDDPARSELGVSVAEGMRRRGLGFLLMRAAEDWAKRAGFEQLELSVFAANFAARALYGK